MIHIIQILQTDHFDKVAFWAVVKGNSLTLYRVDKSSHLVTILKTDAQTHTQIDRQTKWLGHKHNTFFQGYDKVE